MKRIIQAIVAVAVLVAMFATLAACDDEGYVYQLKQRPDVVEHGPVGMDNVTNLSMISRLNDNVFSYGSSSYDRRGSNNDGFTSGNFLYQDEQGRYVICDAKGSGVITRIWMLGNAVNGATSHLQIYVDGAEEPVVDVSYNEFISGSRPPFNDVFCVRDGQGGGVHVCYLTMEFEESIYAVMTEPNGFWQLDCHMVDDVDKTITSMTGEEDYTAEEMILQNLGAPLAGYTQTHKEKVTVAAGKTQTILELTGPKQISYIEIKPEGLRLPQDLTDRTSQNLRELLNGLKLQAYWDGMKQAYVDAPFSMLFGMGTIGYNAPTQGLMYGVKDDGTLYFYFPMPFEKSAELHIRNDSSIDVSMDIQIGYCDVKSDFYNIGYFSTRYSNFYTFCQDPFEAVMLDVQGSGKVVSIQENVFGQVGNVWYEEGDHRIYVDGAKTPQMIGCGTEDFYNGAGYFIKGSDTYAKLGLYSRMFSGYTNYLSLYNDEEALLNEGISVYRTFVTDAINFRKGITLTFEHGGGEFSRSPSRTWNTNQTAGYEVLVCLYYQPVSKMTATDGFVVSDSAAAESHSYESAADSSATVQSSFYGTFGMFTKDRTFVTSSGDVSFTMALDPSNYGAVLYRVYDQLEYNIGAEVYVDDTYVGQWYKAGNNSTYRFADDWFVIPEAFTAGKSSIRITIKPNTDSKWNAEQYILYSRVDKLLEESLPASGSVFNIASGNKRLDHIDSEFDMGGNYLTDPVKMAKKDDTVEQDFRLIRYEGNIYCIVGQGSGTLLSQNQDSVVRKMYPNSKLGDSELWELIPDGKGYRIRNVQSGLYMQVNGEQVTMSEKGTVFTLTSVLERKLCIF